MESYLTRGTRQTAAGWGYTLIMFGSLSYAFGWYGIVYALGFVALCVVVQVWNERSKLKRGAFRRGVLVALAMRKPSRPVYDHLWEIGPIMGNGRFFLNA